MSSNAPASRPPSQERPERHPRVQARRSRHGRIVLAQLARDKRHKDRLRYREIASHLSTPLSTVHRWVNPPKRTARTLLVEEARRAIGSVIASGLCHTLSDVRGALASSFGIRASRSTLSRAARGAFSQRRVYPICSVNPGVHTLRDTFHGYFSSNTEKWDNIISVDECAIYLHRNRQKLWYRKGCRLRVVQPTNRLRPKLTMLMAVDRGGVVHWKLMDHNCNKRSFVEFIDELGGKALGRDLLMDNVAFHKSVETREAYGRHALTPYFTPPYTSEWNPIERVFSSVKARFANLVDQHSDTWRAMHQMGGVVRDVGGLGAVFDHVRGLVTNNLPLGGNSVVMTT
jgi:transposase